MPRGWSGGPRETLFLDEKPGPNGKPAARLQRDARSSNQFSSLTTGIPADFTGAQIELRGLLKTQDVTGFAGLWLREDGESDTVAFDNMQNRQLNGTHDWAEYSIKLPLRDEARQVYFGVLTAGTGTTWASEIQLLVDGKPIWEAPARPLAPKTPIELDHEFDGGSRISLSALSLSQIANLAALGKVWGFLKYHHPAVTAGQRHWDYDLFRVLPKVLGAADRRTANAVFQEWIASLGPVKDCEPCAGLNSTNLQMKPDVDWISDESEFGAELSGALKRVWRDRLAAGRQFYVSFNPNVGNPSFDHEPAYRSIRLPDAGYQLLALYRVWNIIEYWYPNRDILGENWDTLLQEFIPRVALAENSETYQRELMAFIARIHDTHANLWSSLRVRPPVGGCQIPVVPRFVENSAVISAYAQADGAAGPPDLKIGDVILDLDGVPVSELVSRWSPYYADSNDAARMRDIGNGLTRGSCGPAALRIRRGDQTLTVTVPRVPLSALNPRAGSTHDLAGPAFRKLSDEVAYLKLSSVKAADAARYIEDARGTTGLIIDIRNYPSEFMVFALGSLLVDKPVEFVRFTGGDPANPGAFHWGAPLSLTPQQPHYSGKVIILVDEVSQSQAEYTSMAFRKAPGALVIGSTTAGADGNTSAIPLPGGFQTMISGIGVFYPDKKPTQRVGIVPDREVTPTVAGIRAGRDEVLEEALRRILGPAMPQARIEALTKP